ncbi:glycoside hydrolase family 5 protein, partial [bacterium]|nr:glycoside hydrolase family 5 protein [bacterium]
MNLSALVVLSIALSSVPGLAQQVRPPLLQAGFEGPAALEGWQFAGTGTSRLVERDDQGHAIYLERPAESPGGAGVRQFSLPVDQIAGKMVTLQADVRAEELSVPPQSWNGVKFMLQYRTPSGNRYPQMRGLGETRGWRSVFFTVRVPADALEARLVLGLEAVSGKMWFDNVRIDVGRPAAAHKYLWDGQHPIFTGRSLPRLRGTMVGGNLNEDSLSVLGKDWNANVLRWQVNWAQTRPAKADPTDAQAWDAWLDDALDHLEAVLPLCEKYGVMVVVDLHSQPTVKDELGKPKGIFESVRAQDRFVESWERIARRMKGRDLIWAYDLCNEPNETSQIAGVPSWHDLANRTAKAIRVIDPVTPLIVEPGIGAGPDGFDDFWPIDDSRTIYSVHMYMPHTFTHQGVKGQAMGFSYPGLINGEQWDKDRLRRVLQPVVDFQKDFGVHIFVGEFSAIRWAPGDSALNYLRDCIDLFEEHGWDWTYHAFR